MIKEKLKENYINNFLKDGSGNGKGISRNSENTFS